MLDVLRRGKVDRDGGVVEDGLLLLSAPASVAAAAALSHARLRGEDGYGFLCVFSRKKCFSNNTG